MVPLVAITPTCLLALLATIETTGSITFITGIFAGTELLTISKACDEAVLHAITIALQFCVKRKSAIFNIIAKRLYEARWI